MMVLFDALAVSKKRTAPPSPMVPPPVTPPKVVKLALPASTAHGK